VASNKIKDLWSDLIEGENYVSEKSA
jgi:hypothetical protein